MKNFRKQAQSLIEYGLILGLVAVIALTILSKFGSSVTKVGDNANNAVNAAGENAQNNYCTSIGKKSYSVSTGTCE